MVVARARPAGQRGRLAVVVVVVGDGRGGGRHGGGAAAGPAPVRRAHGEAPHVLLGVEQDDVHLGREQAAQRHPGRQRDGHAQRQRLHLLRVARGEVDG